MAILVAMNSLAVVECATNREQTSVRATGGISRSAKASFRTICPSARNHRALADASAAWSRQRSISRSAAERKSSAVCNAAAEPESAPVIATTAALNYHHIMLALADPSPYFGDGSKQAIVTTGMLAAHHKSKVTVLMLDEKSMDTEDNVRRMDILTTSLKEQGCSNFEVVDQVGAPSCSAAIGDVADDVEASLLIMSTEAIHTKRVDSNLLAEFVPCPMLMLP